MTDIRLIGEIRDRRQLYLAQLTRLEDWPTQLEEPARPFVVFTAFDAKRLTDDELLQFARRLLDQGCIYACSWGPEALRVHNAFDTAIVDARLAEKPYVDWDDTTIPTTSHEDESLDDALWYAAFSAYPAYGEVTAVIDLGAHVGRRNRVSLGRCRAMARTFAGKRRRKADHDRGHSSVALRCC